MELDLKRDLCKAFCDDIFVRDVPSGFAVSTSFDGLRGDPIGFYVVGPDFAGRFRIQDDGRTIPYLEAAGVDLSSGSRKQSFFDLLTEYGAEYDDDFELFTDPVSPENIPAVTMRFVAMMLRVQDLLFLTQEKVASTFKEDVLTTLRETVGDVVKVSENAPVSPKLEDYEADLVLIAAEHDPVAVYLVTYDVKVQEAIILQLIAQHEAKVPCKVVALIESSRSVSAKMRQRADNRLDATPVFRGDERAAVAKLQKLATGEAPFIY